MTVWVIHPVDQDLSAASQWGEIRYITDRHIYGDEIENEELPDKFRIDLYKAACSFDYEEDYFLLIGDQLQLVAFAGMLSERKGCIRVLRYDKKAEGYIPVFIPL